MSGQSHAKPRDPKERDNTMNELINYFHIPGKPMSNADFIEFWDSMSPDEQLYYRTIDLSL